MRYVAPSLSTHGSDATHAPSKIWPRNSRSGNLVKSAQIAPCVPVSLALSLPGAVVVPGPALDSELVGTAVSPDPQPSSTPATPAIHPIEPMRSRV